MVILKKKLERWEKSN